jgi:V/A-type H+-transporting ATPase subunit F
MKAFLISDNVDTLVGLKFAGIDGIVLHEKN